MITSRNCQDKNNHDWDVEAASAVATTEEEDER
jgi:hypothetical protein